MNLGGHRLGGRHLFDGDTVGAGFLGEERTREIVRASGDEALLVLLADVSRRAEDGLVVVDAGPMYLLVLVGARLEIGADSIDIQRAAQRIVKESGLTSA